MTDHVKNQLCARIEELEKEKLELNEQLDELQKEPAPLAAHVERQRETLQWIWDKVNLGGRAHDRVKSALADTPETSLARLKAQWQAEALDKAAEIADRVDGGPSQAGREIAAEAERLRRQAEGGV